jgi:hypothetical protein
MTNTDKNNPLFDSQREKSGSMTFDKYSFQYHWALYRIISEHEDLKEYAIIIELHEDVVITDSLDSSVAKFEFNQVKTTSTPFNTNQLVKKKKNGSSVLGKLIQSVNGKPYSKQVNSLNLIATSKFNLELKKEDVELKTITKSDLSDKQLKDLESELLKEIGVANLPTNIKFIISDIPDTNYQTFLIGAIAELINKIFPGSYSNAQDIYTLLIDELYRKGKVTYDFTKWDDLLKDKALTSLQVTRVINEFTNLKDEARIEAEFNSICLELGLKSIEARRLKRSFSRYRRQRISNRSTLQMDTTKFFVKEIDLNISKGVTEMKELIESIQKIVPTKIGKQFTSKDEITTALICEYIMMS